MAFASLSSSQPLELKLIRKIVSTFENKSGLQDSKLINFYPVCYINNGTVKPEEEKLVAVIPTFMPAFNIYLKVSNIRIQSGGWHNLFQVTKPGTNHWNQPGNRMASIYFRHDYFHICTDRSGKSNKCLNKKVSKTSQDGNTAVFEGPFHFQFVQKENENGDYVQTISMNGETLVNEINTDPKSVKDAELYIAVKKPHNYIPLNAEIEDFKLQTGKIILSFFIHFKRLDCLFHFRKG